MESLSIIGTQCTPTVAFLNDGRLLMEGRSLPEDVNIFYEPLEKWLSELVAETVILDVKLEYFNSASSKKILNLLKTIDANSNIKEIVVNWHYEEGDEDNLESGQIFEELMLRSQFKFFEFAEAV